MSQQVVIVNLEMGMPTVDVALKRLSGELAMARAQRVVAMKLIHGYGSSGTGGKLRVAIRKELERLRLKQSLKAWIPGETWEIFNPEAIRFLDACDSLRGDRDLGMHNNGISMVLLR